MLPAGYMAKRLYKRPEWRKAPHVTEIYSVSSHISEHFADYIPFWKHNGYWLFDSPEIIRSVADANSISLEGVSLFYYEVYEKEFNGESWADWSGESSIPTDVIQPSQKKLEGYDVVTFWAKSSPECSPLSCNSLAENVHTNTHCLFESFAEAETNLNNGTFTKAEPGPYRIFSVYSVDWH